MRATITVMARWWLPWVLASSSFACATDAASDPEDFVDDWVARQCALASACDCSRDRSECEQSLGAALRDAQAEAMAAGATFDAACLQAHRDGLEARGCKDPSELEAAGKIVSCLVYRGEKQLGEPCTSYDVGASRASVMSDCAEGLTCPLIGERCVEAGEPGVVGAEGDPCVGSDGRILVICAEGTACDFGDTKTCVVPRTLGMTCPHGEPCAGGYCDAGTCAPRRPVGEGCSEPGQCETFACVMGTCAEPAAEAAACTPLFP